MAKNRVNRCKLLVYLMGSMLLAAFGVPSALGDGVIRDGLGAVSIGRGGSNIAHADNGQMLLDNPAAMVNMAGCGLAEFSTDILLTDLHYRDPENDVFGEVKPYPMPQLAYIRKAPGGTFAYGVGVYAPAGFGAEYDIIHPVFGLQRQKSFGALLKVLPGASVLLTDRLSVGGTFGLAASHVELEGPFHLQSGPLPGAPALLDLQSTGASIAWNLGMQYRVNPCTTFGVAFTGETRMRLDGDARAFVPGLGQSDFDADVRVAWPRSLGFGMTHAPSQCNRFSADVIWYDWSHAFDHIEMTFSNPSNPAYAFVLGNSFTDQFPLNWRDSVAVRLGYEHVTARSGILRCGYTYHDQTIPASTLTPYIPAILEHAVSVGCGRRIWQTDVDLSYQYSWGPTRQVGNSAILGNDFDNSSMRAAAHWMSISFIRRF